MENNNGPITQESTQETPETIIQENISPNADYEQPAIGAGEQVVPMSETPEYLPQSQVSPEAIKHAAAVEMNKIQNLMRAGVIHPLQGQNLMNHIIQRAYTMISTQEGGATIVSGIENSAETEEFFKTEGRSEVLDYLKKSGVVDKGEISQITKLVEKIEKSAVENYLRRLRHEKTLNDENQAAKQRLRVNAQKSGSGENMRTVFTREQIGKMSGAEFAKYERAIMEQLRKGQIR